MNTFDRVYFLNLDHRTDRLEHITSEFQRMGVDQERIHRISAVYEKGFGILGCTKSHILALEEFLASPVGNKTCVIFEDDFQFTQAPEMVHMYVDRFFNEVDSFDVVMLSSNTLHDTDSGYDFLRKILDAQTMSGYAVSRDFAPILLQNLREAANLLQDAGMTVPAYCCDIYWKNLQSQNRWYCFEPRLGIQRDSFSDIENRIVDYQC